jgi:RNA polymerase sigma-70 factor, ECF subfamily
MGEHRDLEDRSDEELVRAALADPDAESGRQAAGELLGRHRGRVYAWCLRHLGDHERALDLAQEVLIGAWRRLDTFGGQCPFVCWLWAIARNRCLSELRRPALLRDEGFDLDELPTARPSPDRELEDRLDEERVLALVARHLDPVEQRALWLRCFERMPVDAITLALGLTEATGARAVLQRARRKLRAALDRPEEEGTPCP